MTCARQGVGGDVLAMFPLLITRDLCCRGWVLELRATTQGVTYDLDDSLNVVANVVGSLTSHHPQILSPWETWMPLA